MENIIAEKLVGSTTMMPTQTSISNPIQSLATRAETPLNVSPLSSTSSSSSVPSLLTSLTNESQLELDKLDKAIRSSNIGEQCEGIVLSSKLLLLPHLSNVVINSLVLKLADLFRTSNNFIRFQIFGVIKQCESQMSKVLTISEVLKRIGSVLQSNDPIARAITLRTLGSIPSIISDQLHIHHGIRNCLNSHHQLEIDAAIFAIDQLCSKSSVFATGIISKLAAMIEGIETSLSTKLKLIRTFRHMHYTPQIAQQARKICCDLLQIYATRGFFLTVLDTLTCLSEKVLLDIPDQIQLLLDAFSKDPRESVKVLVLSNLNRIAKISPHQNFHISELLHFLHSSHVAASIQCGILQLLETLSFHSNQELTQHEASILKFCEMYVFTNNILGTRRSGQMFCNIYLKHKEKDFKTSNQTSTLVRFISNLCSVLSSKLLDNQISLDDLEHISSLLKIIQNVMKIDESTCCPIFFETVISLLPQVENPVAELLCVALPSFIALNRRAIFPFIPQIVDFLEKSLLKNSNFVIPICKILVLSYESNVPQRNVCITQLEPILHQFTSSTSNLQLRLAKITFCHGFQNLSLPLWKQLSLQLESEYFASWIQALQYISQAESQLVESLGHLPNSIQLLYMAQTLLTASSSPLSNFHFQLKVIQFRISFLEQVSSLRNLLQDSYSMVNLNCSLKEISGIYSIISRDPVDHLKPQSKLCLQDMQIVCLLISLSIKLLIVDENSNSQNLKKLDVATHPDLQILRDLPIHSRSSLFSTCKAFYDMLIDSNFKKDKLISGFLEKVITFPTSYPLDFFVHRSQVKN